MKACYALSIAALVLAAAVASAAEWPGPAGDGYLLPNGWRITPLGKAIPTEDLLLNIATAPDGRSVVALHGGFNPHGLVVVDVASEEAVQRIPLPTAWLGLAWSPDGKRLYVSGGNNDDDRIKEGVRAPIYVFDYADGRLSDAPVAELVADLPPTGIFWSGLAHHPARDVLYAANRVADNITVFDTAAGKPVGTIETEVTPYDLVLSPDGNTLYCSNWGSDTVSVIDTASGKTTAVLAMGDNPNDMVLAPDGRLFVACSGDNTVAVVDTAAGRRTESIVTSLHPRAPEGSTPNALALDPKSNTLYVANADNNNVCVVGVEEAGESAVLGFIPAGWYPSALGLSPDGEKLFVGNAKGGGSYSNIRGPHSPYPPGGEGEGSVKSLQKGSINVLGVPALRDRLGELTKQCAANTPYSDELLAKAKPHDGPSVIPSSVGAGSPIKHVLYIIKENRTYDQVLGDMPQGNGDPRLCLFGREITPNHHAVAEQFVLLDNLYCDAEVSRDGHQWSNAAYATDFNEKHWPASYGGRSGAFDSPAVMPDAGYLWDQCARKGLTYRTYGEFAERVSEEDEEPLMGPRHPRLGALHGHVAPRYLCWDARDTDNANEFFREFDEYEKNFDNADPEKRLPNFVVMSLPEDHTKGTRPGVPTPRASVASNDYALGRILDRVSHSRYWPQMAVFVIEDDAQDGADHVDARRTVGLVASPYCKRGIVDSTLYTTCSMLRTIELLLGLQPMSQYDAAATPMYASFGDTPDMTPYAHLGPKIDLDEKNTATAWGADASMKMDLSSFDRAPMFALNEIVWKSVKGADSEMPVPVHRFWLAGLNR